MSTSDTLLQTMSGRNLVVCLDGTANKFSATPSNVLKLFSMLENNPETQLRFYQSGAGTYTGLPVIASVLNALAEGADFAWAWNFQEHVVEAYTWLMENWQPLDKIFILGFSRGAYAARALSGMIDQVGLLDRGMESQVALAYDVYRNRGSEAFPMQLQNGAATAGSPERYKQLLGRDVDIYFVGVWDTVSSLAVLYSPALPYTRRTDYFRQALALDERRAKFQPEFFHPEDIEGFTNDYRPGFVAIDDPIYPVSTGGKDLMVNDVEKAKEVWFCGVHSDVGGGIEADGKPAVSNISLRWMIREMISLPVKIVLKTSEIIRGGVYPGLESFMAESNEHFYSHLVESANIDGRYTGIETGLRDRNADIHDSMTWFWRPVEVLPFLRSACLGGKRTRSMWPNLFRPRSIPQDAFHIHNSVRARIREGDYTPRARLPFSSQHWLPWTPEQPQLWRALAADDTQDTETLGLSREICCRWEE